MNDLVDRVLLGMDDTASMDRNMLEWHQLWDQMGETNQVGLCSSGL